MTTHSVSFVIRSAAVAAMFAILLAPSTAWTQTRTQPGSSNIIGRIIVPIPGFGDMFEVRLVENVEQLVQVTFADSLGRYNFNNVPRGTYYVLVSLEGFQDVRQRVDMIGTGDTTINIILDFKEEKTVIPATDFSGEDAEVVDVADLSRNHSSQLVGQLKTAEKEVQSGNYAKALPVLEEIVRQAPDLYQAHRLLGITYQKAVRFRDAESEFKTAAELRQTSAAPLINLGSLYIEEAEASTGQGSAVVRGILNQALGSLNAAVKVKPDASFAYYLLGVTYYRSAFFEDAEDHLKHALDFTPDLLEARLALANVYIKMQEWPNVIAQLDAFLAANPRSQMKSQIEKLRAQIVARSQAKLR